METKGELRIQARSAVAPRSEKARMSLIAGILLCSFSNYAAGQDQSSSPATLCALEDPEFNRQHDLAVQIAEEKTSGQNAIRESELKQKLADLQKQHVQARIKFFDGKVTRVERDIQDRGTKWTASFLQGQKKFESLKVRILKVSAPFLDVFNLLVAVDCPQPQPLIVLSINISDSDLQRNFSTIGDFKPEYPTSSLAELRASLGKLNVGDFATVSGYAQIFMYNIPFSTFNSYLLRTETIPPRSPDVREVQNGSELTAVPNSSQLKLFQKENTIMITYNAKITEIRKQ